MKLSVSAFRAQASAQRKILSSYQNQLNYGACTSFPALGGFKLEEKPQMMVDNTGISPPSGPKPNEQPRSSGDSATSQEDPEDGKMEERGRAKDKDGAQDAVASQGKREDASVADKSPGKTRTKSNQRWMKLRTTVQISGAITSTNQKSKPTLKREDSFLKRFSTRQIPETQETVDTGDETETLNGSQTQNEVNRRRRKRRKELSKTVVNPDENFYFYWLMTVTVCVLYNLWTLIVRQSFPELQKAASAFWYSGDGFTDVVFVCDIFVQFRTGYLEQGLMVYDSKKLASHYLKSRAFTLDILSLLPLDFLQLNIGVNPILRFPRFLKIYRVYNYYYIVESRTVYPNLWRVVNLIHILLILAHWFGCFYYLLSEAEGFQGDWVYPYRPGDYATLTRKYLGSLYWSTLTLTTIGDLPTPETNAESRGGSKATTSPGLAHAIPRRGHKSRLLQFNSSYGYLFTIVSYLIGVFIFATIVGQVGNVITNRNANRLEFERLLDGAKTYMRHHKVPGGMKRRVLRWYDYSWSRGRIQGGGDINTALGLLPDKLKTELALHVNLSVLKKVTIFQECQPEFLHDLVLKMKAYIFTPGDLICRKGEVAREMFIIADGILDVISETGRVLTTMKAGDFFGEIGILNLDGLNKRTADVRSVGYSELFSLSREDVLTAMKDYPEAQEILQSLGRKRLMEAKNASKMHKAQAKQAKDHDSSGDSDTAGKRIVEKLRSDVKGLKNALRRSRRGTRTKETFDGIPGSSWGKTSSKKHSILRRMSHVQSSDEYETETAQSPIGAGLPLLQRLKLLKEKQDKDKEKEEKEKGKALAHGPNQDAKDQGSDLEVVGADLSFAQRLKLLKQKEDKESAQSGSSVASSTVRTQVSGVRFDKSLAKSKTLDSPKDSEEKIIGENAKKKDGMEIGKISLKEKLKLIHGIQPKEKAPKLVQNFQEAASSSNSAPETQPETSTNVPEATEADNSVPKSLKSKFEVPKSKDGWKLLKKSSITKTKNDDKLVGKVSKRGTYLSKSDTILEKQKTEEKEEDKWSRSASPSDSPKNRSLKQAVERLMRERRRTRSLGNAPGAGTPRDVNFWEYPKESKNSSESKQIKKYDSISDLSPEYSGLPFVKKLKILNERQKLAELEKELLVRSASLDVPDRPGTKLGNVLVRSQSEASTIEITKVEDASLRTELEARWRDVTVSTTAISGPESTTELRSTLTSKKKHGNRLHSDGSIASPESNETLERRHLKSILKKLSAEDSTSDEDHMSKNFKSGTSGFKRSDNAELKKLMRAPTIEGYAARHKKLTKSVTFDSDTLPSPPGSRDPGSPQPISPEENKGKGFSPMSPTAILTLQLSNLSMIPIVSPKKTEKMEEKAKMEIEKETTVPKTVGKLEEEVEKLRKVEKETENPLMPYFVQDFIEKNFRTLPFTKNQDDELFGEIKGGIHLIIQSLLEEVQNKFQSQFNSLQVEVKKRDEIILQLQSKIQQLEKDSSRVPSRGSFEGLDSSETDPDMSDVPFLRGDSFETILGVNSPTGESKRSPRSSPGVAETSLKETVVEEKKEEDFRCDDPDSRFDYPNNAIAYEEIKNYSETEDDVYEMKDKICLLSDRDSDPSKRWLWRPLDPASDEELELLDMSRSSRSEDRKRKRVRTELRLKRNLSVDETQLQGKSQRKGQREERRSKGCLLDRVTDFQRSFSVCHDNKDFVALDIDDSSNSSDLENPHIKDWEVQMLVEELEKKESAMGKDSGWEGENEDLTSETETDAEQLEDVKKLQEEVNTLKQMVCESDLARLTGSELDILETIIEAKDQKISQIAKSSSLDDEDNGKQKKQIHIGTSSTNKLKRIEQKKKPSSLRQKIGQALSFDFHDIESRKSKSPDHAKLKSFSLRKQKTISGTNQERQSLYTLWHTSSLLRNRVLENPDEANKNLTNQSTSGNSRSSLPILISSSFGLEKSSDVRTSLPTLSGKDFRTNFADPVTSSVSSSEDTYRESDFKQSCDSVFEETVDVRSVNHPSTSGYLRPNESHNSLNSFIKSVGQRVKQVMAGDMNTVKSQVPTISKLCDEQSILKEVELGCSEEFGGISRRPSEEEAKAADADNSKLLDCNPKTEPPDL